MLAGTDQGIYQRKYGSWTKVDSVSAFCVAGSDTEVFAGTYHGVIRSDNKGKTWSIPDSSLGRINALAINKTTIYAVGSGLYKSKDNGKTWNKIGNGLSQNMYPIHGITINDTLLLAATNTGLIISADGGKHWTIPSQPGDLTDYSITHIDTTLFAGTSKGLLRSTDGGKKWIRVASIADTLSVYSLAVNTVQSYLYAETDIGVFRSTNQGKTWTAINNWLPTYLKQVYTVFMLQKYRKNIG